MRDAPRPELALTPCAAHVPVLHATPPQARAGHPGVGYGHVQRGLDQVRASQERHWDRGQQELQTTSVSLSPSTKAGPGQCNAVHPKCAFACKLVFPSQAISFDRTRASPLLMQTLVTSLPPASLITWYSCELHGTSCGLQSSKQCSAAHRAHCLHQFAEHAHAAWRVKGWPAPVS